MSTTPQLRLERVRHPSAVFRSSGLTVLSALMILSGSSLALAQQSALSKADFRSVETVAENLALSRAIKSAHLADRASRPSRSDIERYLGRQAKSFAGSSFSGFSRRLSKGASGSSIFEDMQAVPDQDLENTRGYFSPVFVALPGNVIGMAYTDRGIGGAFLDDPPLVNPRPLFRTSSDGGMTWTDPVAIFDDADFILDFLWPSIAVTASGRVVFLDETPFEDNHSAYSDNMGATWTAVDYEETDALDRLVGPVNGKLWVQAGEFFDDFGNFIQSDVRYIESEDGITWSEEKTMIASIPANASADITDITQTGPMSYLATFDMFLEDPCCRHIGLSRSTDGGATWSPLEMVETGVIDPRSAVIDAYGDGRVALTFVGSNEGLFSNDDIFISMSTDGGATFGTPVLFTRYVGGDLNPAQVVTGDVPLIGFVSERGNPDFKNRIWLGNGGEDPTPDVDPPPVVAWSGVERGWVPANRAVQAPTVFAGDESGVASVGLLLTREGEEYTVELFDDGLHSDEEAGDGIFSGTLDPVDYGPGFHMLPVGMDDGGNEGYGVTQGLTVAALHDVGSLVLAVSPEGAMGWEPLGDFDEPRLAFRYPKNGGFNFAPYVGLWAGIAKTPGKRVSHLFYDNLFGTDVVRPENGDWRVTEYPTEGPGESENDIVMHYDDSRAPYPIGLAVKQTTYQWGDANYVIFDYEITNESGEDQRNVYIAMALDPDMPVGGDFSDDRIAYDPDRALLYAFDSGAWCQSEDPEYCTDTYVGLALISDGTDGLAKSTPTPHTVTRWTGFEPPFDPERDQLGLDRDMYDLMTSGIWAGFNIGVTTANGEWRMLITAQPIDFAAGETTRIVFGLLAAQGEAGIKAAADAMVDRFEKAVLDVTQTDPIPREFALSQNYPNPFNPSTTIAFSIDATSPVSLTVFDVLGRQVGEIVNKTLSAGSYRATFESNTLPSGAYYYTLTAGGQSITKSMFLLK